MKDDFNDVLYVLGMLEPGMNKLYADMKRDGKEDSEIMDEMLKTVRNCVGAADIHNVGEEKSMQYLRYFHTRMTEWLFLEARKANDKKT